MECVLIRLPQPATTALLWELRLRCESDLPAVDLLYKSNLSRRDIALVMPFTPVARRLQYFQE